MELVNCTEEYWEFVRKLRIDNRVSSGFIKTEFITEEMQKEYMSKHSKHYRIALVDGVPAGYVGVIDGDIRICTHPDFQKKGVGKFMLKNCVEIFPNSFGKVKLDNEVSIKLFESCGFKKKYFLFEYDS